MATISSVEIIVSVGSLVIAAIAILLFYRASGSRVKQETTKSEVEPVEEAVSSWSNKLVERGSKILLPRVERHLKVSDVARARSNLRTLTLQRELLSMVLKRLFEAEDEGEITREERLRLSKDYEAEMKRLGDELKQAELVVTLNELESIREEILSKLEMTLNQTQVRIDATLKELKLEAPRKPKARAPRRKRPQKKDAEEGVGEDAEEGVGEDAEEEKLKPSQRRQSEVEEKLEQLRNEVLKELEELEKLEIEV